MQDINDCDTLNYGTIIARLFIFHFVLISEDTLNDDTRLPVRLLWYDDTQNLFCFDSFFAAIDYNVKRRKNVWCV